MSIGLHERADYDNSAVARPRQEWSTDWLTHLDATSGRAFYVNSGGEVGEYRQPPRKYEVPQTLWDSDLADPLEAGSLDDLGMGQEQKPSEPLLGGIGFGEFMKRAEDSATFDAALNDGIELLRARDAREQAAVRLTPPENIIQPHEELIDLRDDIHSERTRSRLETVKKAFNRKVGAVVLAAVLGASALFQALSPSEGSTSVSSFAAQSTRIEHVIDDVPPSLPEQPTATISLPELAKPLVEESIKRAAATATTTVSRQAASSQSTEPAPSAHEASQFASEINGTSWERVKSMYDYLRQQHHLSPRGAAYFMGNILQEAGPGARPDAYNAAEHAFGFIQAQNGREKGMPLDNTYRQLDWLLDEEAPRDGQSPHLKAILTNPASSDEQIRQAIKLWIRWGDPGNRWYYADQILVNLIR